MHRPIIGGALDAFLANEPRAIEIRGRAGMIYLDGGVTALADDNYQAVMAPLVPADLLR